MTVNARLEQMLREGRANRRAVLRAALGLAIAGFAGGAHALKPAGSGPPKPKFVGYPFTLGVASGFPTPNGVTLWTRLAPGLLYADGAMSRENVHVTFEVAEDEAFGKVVATGERRAVYDNAHSVRATVAGLKPGRWYFYRFHAGDETSPVGRTRTADAPDAAAKLRFAIACCQHYEQGWFVGQRHMAEEDVDLVVFLGDYVYEGVWGDPVRRFLGADAFTVDEYRLRHAQTKSDRDLQRLHARVPFLCAWDDHEVDNDYAGDFGESRDPRFLQRRAAGYQAYLEHMPIPEDLVLRNGEVALYGYSQFGRDVGFHLLDTRQWRTAQACQDPYKGGGSANVRDCAALEEPGRTMLGATQKAWLLDGLAKRRTKWTFLAQQTVMAPIDALEGPGEEWWTDPWDGYPGERREILDALVAHRVSNPVVLGGDLHTTLVTELRHGARDAERGPVVASEFCTTSLASEGWPAGSYDGRLRENPHVRYANPQDRGYLRFDVERGACNVALRVVDMKDPRSAVKTEKRWVVEDGVAGPREA